MTSKFISSPAAQQVHRRRCSDSLLTDGTWEANVKSGEYHRGVFEKQFGNPTDIDAVWAERDRIGVET